MVQPVTTILLAPSGAGKSTLIDGLREDGHEFVHVSRDGMLGEALHHIKLDSPMSWTPQDRRRLGEAIHQAEENFYLQMQGEFEKNSPHVVIDFPPGGSQKWMDEAIIRSKAAGRKVVVEGIIVDPEQAGLQRILERDPPTVINPESFKSWVATYQNMPRQFSEAVQAADEASLFDNNAPGTGKKPKLIALWSGGKTEPHTILDEDAYAGLAPAAATKC